MVENKELLPVEVIGGKELEKRDLSEELATLILGRMQETDKLQLKFMNSSLTNKEKLEAIIQFKTCMLIPSLKKAMGIDQFNDQELQGSYAVIDFLQSIENSIRQLINFEDNEIVDFSHPKIVESYRILFEIVVEVIQEEIKDQIAINNIIEKTAIRCVNIENEFNKLFKKLSNRMANMVKNPFLKPFENKDRDPIIVKKRLLEELWRSKNILDIPEIDILIEVLNQELEQE